MRMFKEPKNLVLILLSTLFLTTGCLGTKKQISYVSQNSYINLVSMGDKYYVKEEFKKSADKYLQAYDDISGYSPKNSVDLLTKICWCYLQLGDIKSFNYYIEKLSSEVSNLEDFERNQHDRLLILSKPTLFVLSFAVTTGSSSENIRQYSDDKMVSMLTTMFDKNNN